MSIALDAGFPVSSNQVNVASLASIVSGSFTTPASNRLVVVVCSWAGSTAAACAPLSISGAGLVWTKLVEKSFFLTGNGSAAITIFWAWASSVVTAQTVTVSRTGTDVGAQDAILDVYSLSGADQFQIGGVTGGQAGSGSSAKNVALTPLSGSWVLWGVMDGGTSGGVAQTASGNNTKDSEAIDATHGNTVSIGRYTGAAPGGSITVGCTGSDTFAGVAAGEILVDVSSGNYVSVMNGRSSIIASTLFLSGVLDFGNYPGSNEASLTITGQGAIASNSQIEAYFMASDSTGTHSASDHQYAGCYIKLTCGSVIPGVGFTISGRSTQKMQGTFKVHWVWA